MKDLYIKFKEWDTESLIIAVIKAESLWYTKIDTPWAIAFEWTWILRLNDDWVYYTSTMSEEDLVESWYEEYIPANTSAKIEKVYIVMWAWVNSCDGLELEVFWVFSNKEKAESFYLIKNKECLASDLSVMIVEKTLDFEYTNRTDISYLWDEKYFAKDNY